MSRFRAIRLSLLILVATTLTGCLTTGSVQQRPGVAEAKACVKALQSNATLIPGFIIKACTNTGVWQVDQVDPQGLTIASYDFVNRDYAGAETGFSPVPVDSLGEDQINAYKSVQKTINQQLVEAF